MNRCTIILLYVSVQYTHVHYNTALYVSVVCTSALFYCSLSVQYVQVHYNTAAYVSVVCAGVL